MLAEKQIQTMGVYLRAVSENAKRLADLCGDLRDDKTVDGCSERMKWGCRAIVI